MTFNNEALSDAPVLRTLSSPSVDLPRFFVKRALSFNLLALFLLCGLARGRGQAVGQAEYGLGEGQAAILQVGGQFQFTRANAPPGQCGCFWMQGGGLQAGLAIRPKWSAMADVYFAHNGQINSADETLSVFNYVFGPRYWYRNASRYTPYAQALVGLSHVTSNYSVYTSNNTYLAAQGGAGLEMNIKPRISLVPIEANWVYSQAKNGINGRQNNLRVGVGVVYRLGHE